MFKYMTLTILGFYIMFYLSMAHDKLNDIKLSSVYY